MKTLNDSLGYPVYEFNQDELDERRKILRDVLGVDFQRLFDYYRELFEHRFDLYVFMCRKAWCMVNLFLPLLEQEISLVDRAILTHDKMISLWFANFKEAGGNPATVKVLVEDDTYMSGRALDDCILRLMFAHGIAADNISVKVFAFLGKDKINQSRIHEDKYKVYVPKDTMHDDNAEGPFEVNWLSISEDQNRSRTEISALSERFVEAMHACSQPYIGYFPAFRLPFDKALSVFFGSPEDAQTITRKAESAFIEASDFITPFCDGTQYLYNDITIAQQIKHGVEAFYFDPAPGNRPDYFPPKEILSTSALRFYVNFKTHSVIMVPYVSLEACDAETDIKGCFPKELQFLAAEQVPTEQWSDYEGKLVGVRLLRYVVSYVWGRDVLSKHFGIKDKNNAVSSGGIVSDVFWNWIQDDEKARKDLIKAWGKYPKSAPLGADVDEEYNKEIETSLSFVDDIRDYFATAMLMFRDILDKENRLMQEQKEPSLPRVPAFPGFPVDRFKDLLKSKFPQLKDRESVIPSIMYMLCDTGGAVTHVYQRNGYIGSVIVNGEQSCHALLQAAAPEYALLLSELKTLLPEDKDEQEKWLKDLRVVLEAYYTRTDGNQLCKLSVKQLLHVFDKQAKAISDGNADLYPAFCAIGKYDYYDPAGGFLDIIRERLKERLPLILPNEEEVGA